MKPTHAICVALFLSVLLLGVVLHNPGLPQMGTSWATRARFTVYAFDVLLFLLLLGRVSVPYRYLPMFLYGFWVTSTAIYTVSTAQTLAQTFVLWAFLLLSVLVRQYCLGQAGNESADAWLVVAHALHVKVLISLMMPLLSVRWSLVREGGDITASALPHVPRLGGIMGAPNSLGYTAGLGFILSFILVRTYSGLGSWQNRAIRMGGVLSLVALLWSQSRTAIIAVVVGVMAYVYVKRRQRAVVYLVVVVLVACVLVASSPEYLLSLATRGEGGASSLVTLQGRTVIWEHVLRLVKKRPVLGYGYGASKVLLPSEWTLSRYHKITQAHNMLMEALLTTGVIGTVLLGVVWVQAVVAYSRRMRADSAGWLPGWAVIWMGLLAGVSEPSLAYAQSIISLVVMLAYAMGV